MRNVTDQIQTALAEDLPSGWSLASIEDLVGGDGVFVDGDWVESKDQDPTGDVRLIQLADIGDGVYRNKSDRFLTHEKALELGCTFLRRDDVLIARMPDPLGRACIFPGDPKKSVTVVDVAIARSGNGEFNHRWLMYFINAPVFRTVMASLQSGSTRKRISRGNLARIRLPVPPREQQNSIVAEIEKQFSRLDEAVANLKRVKANLKRYKAAVLKAAVEGSLVPTEAELSRQTGRSYETAAQLLKVNEKRLSPQPTKRRAGRLWGAGHVPQLTPDELSRLPEGWTWAKVRQVGLDPEDAVQVGPMSMKSDDFIEAGVPVLNVGCVQWGHFNETKLNFLPEKIAEDFSRYRIQPGDVLFTRSGTVGRCAVARPHQRNWLMTFHLLRARPNPKCCLPEYLRAVFEGAAHIRRQTREASIGTTRAGFNTNLLANLDVPLPPMAEQKRIVAEVERRLSVMDELEAAVEANLTRANRLRQSILSQAFAGRLLPCRSDEV